MKLVNNNRITLKWYDDNPPNKSGYIWNDINDVNQNYSHLKKFGQLEDIEEEQGLEFLKCREIQKSRSVVLTNEFGFASELHDVCMYIGDGEVAIITKDDGIFYYQLSQYGQTWALTKEELNNA